MLERLVLVASLCLPLACRGEAPPDAPEEAAQGAAGEAEPEGEVVALHLSFDDAPGMGFAPGTRPQEAAAFNELNARLLATLEAHEAEASVFYNCDKLLPGDETIEAWEGAGMEVGNHTASHADLAKVGLDAWLEDVRRCDEILRERLSSPPGYLRYPYLSQGDTVELRDAASEALAQMGYANAHVTAATTEWLLAMAYSVAKRRGDAELAGEIVAAYRKHMLDAVEAARALAHHELGRETAQVVLFHVNELAADHLDEVLDDYEAAGYRFVGLDEALADPVFELQDRFAGTSGISWLARIHDPEQPRPAYWFGVEEGRLNDLFGHLLAPPEDEARD